MTSAENNWTSASRNAPVVSQAFIGQGAGEPRQADGVPGGRVDPAVDAQADRDQPADHEWDEKRGEVLFPVRHLDAWELSVA